MDRLPPLRLLTIFDAVQRLGSMQLAAAEMNVSRPAVSQAIRALEDHVGARLMDRSVKPAVATEAGQRLAQATRSGLLQMADAIEEIRLTTSRAQRQVTVCCTLGMATHWLMPRLADFYAQHPDIMVNVQAPQSDLPVFAAGIDIALRYGAKQWTDGDSELLFPERICPVGSAEVIAAVAAGPTRLRETALIHVRVPQSYGWTGWREYLAARGHGQPQGPQQVFDNYIQAVQAALDGRGAMLGWRSITAALVAEGRLVELPDGACDLGTAYWATCAPGSQDRPAANAFMRWIREVSRQMRETPALDVIRIADTTIKPVRT